MPTTDNVITDYRLRYQTEYEGDVRTAAFPTRKAAENFRAMYADGRGLTVLDDGQITERRHVYRIGQTVSVHARGAWRSGRILRVMRTRVDVDYVRNRKGDRHVRAFYPSEIHT